MRGPAGKRKRAAEGSRRAGICGTAPSRAGRQGPFTGAETMPLYFAYGANLDRAAMRERCPGARPLGPARLPDHRFFFMANGWASVARMPRAVVHGLLWDLPRAEIAALDAFEEVGDGLYARRTLPVAGPGGTVRALAYIGCITEAGPPRTGYLETILAAARSLALPPDYLAALASLAGQPCPDDP